MRAGVKKQPAPALGRMRALLAERAECGAALPGLSICLAAELPKKLESRLSCMGEPMLTPCRVKYKFVVTPWASLAPRKMLTCRQVSLLSCYDRILGSICTKAGVPLTVICQLILSGCTRDQLFAVQRCTSGTVWPSLSRQICINASKCSNEDS